jgi:hypothetical protein
MNLFANKLFRNNKSKSSRNQLHPRRLTMEAMEDRHLLSIVSLAPVKDNSLIEYKAPTYSGGADPTLYVGLDHWTSTRMRGLMEFDVAGAVPAGAKINSVTLTVWVNLTASTTTATLNVELHKTLANWGEGTSAPTGFMPPYGKTTTGDATWLHTFYNTQSWATPGGDFSPTASGVTVLGADGTSSTWSSTSQMVSDVQAWLDNPGTNFGWVLKGDETQESGKMIDSRESTTVAHRPTLTIDYTLAAPPPPPPTLAITATDADKAEGNAGSTAFTFTVTRTGDTGGSTSVDFAVTGSGAAQADATDFATGVLPKGTVTFAAGETSKLVTINVNGDTIVEPDEGFTVTLSNPVGGTITAATAAANGTILNDDVSSTTPGLSISDVTLAEGNDGMTAFTFTVTLNDAASGPVSVDYATANGTATAVRPSGDHEDDDHDVADHEVADHRVGAEGDYLPALGTLHFAGNAGETQTITVKVRGDKIVEPDEISHVVGKKASDTVERIYRALHSSDERPATTGLSPNRAGSRLAELDTLDHVFASIRGNDNKRSSF